MTAYAAGTVPETVPTKAEKVFLGLVREGMMRYYVGHAADLSDEDLRAVFALAVATLRKADCLKGFDAIQAPEAVKAPAASAVEPRVGKKTSDSKAIRAKNDVA